MAQLTEDQEYQIKSEKALEMELISRFRNSGKDKWGDLTIEAHFYIEGWKHAVEWAQKNPHPQILRGKDK